jgi:hypothetical protein
MDHIKRDGATHGSGGGARPSACGGGGLAGTSSTGGDERGWHWRQRSTSARPMRSGGSLRRGRGSRPPLSGSRTRRHRCRVPLRGPPPNQASSFPSASASPSASSTSPRGEPLRLVSKHFDIGISTCHKLLLEVPRFLQWLTTEPGHRWGGGGGANERIHAGHWEATGSARQCGRRNVGPGVNLAAVCASGPGGCWR